MTKPILVRPDVDSQLEFDFFHIDSLIIGYKSPEMQMLNFPKCCCHWVKVSTTVW